MIILTIDEPTPSLNPLLRGHWSKNHTLRRRWALLTKAAVRQARIWTPPKLARARIQIDRYGARKLDADNFRGGTKFLTDSLRVEGIIVDDTVDVIGEPELRQIVGKERRTVVRIEPA